jgi:MerR family transcriptional regulator, copper efflux regulator
MQDIGLLTIGELASRVGMRTSALRYYEVKGLLAEPSRSPSGYRLYNPETEHDLRFIQRARRLGFSLNDIRILLKAWRDGSLDEKAFLDTAEKRYLELEHQVTQINILQHELGHFLQDIYQRAVSAGGKTRAFQVPDLLEQICSHLSNPHEMEIFNRLLDHSGCLLQSADARRLFQYLQGMHTHIWQEEEDIFILVVSNDPQVGDTLKDLCQIAKDCKPHSRSHLVLDMQHTNEGYLLQVRGENAFILARLFLMMENSSLSLPSA